MTDNFSTALLTTALKIAHSIQDSEDNIDALNEIARQYNNINQKQRTLEVLAEAVEKAKTIQVAARKSQALNHISSPYIEAGFNNQALEILSESLEIAKTIQEVDDTDFLFVNIAENYGELGYYDEALEIGFLIKDEYRRILHLFIPLIWNYAKNGQHEQLIRVIQSDEDYQSWLWQEAITSYTRNEEINRAFEIISTVQNPYTKTLGLSELASAYSKTGNHNKALELLAQAQQISETIEDKTAAAWAGEIIARKYAEAGEKNTASLALSQALQAGNSIENALHKSMAFNQLAYSYIQAGEYDQALSLFEQIQAPVPMIEKVRLLAAIGAECTKAGLTEKAEEAVKKALEMIPNMTDIPAGLDPQLYQGFASADLVQSFVKLEQYDLALQLLKLLGDGEHKVYILVDIARKYVDSGEREKASEILNQAFAISEKIGDSPYLLSPLISAAELYAKIGIYPRAFETAKAIKFPLYQAKLLAFMAREYYELGHIADEQAWNCLRDFFVNI
ncbi:MAG TPA: hypothetical protein V6D13_04935 [Halomicronema sp.]